MVTETKAFDAKRDSEFLTAGTHFFCEACLVAKPLVEQSPDPRYCRGCFAFLGQEANLLPSGKRPKWMPKAEKEVKQQYPIQRQGEGVLAQTPLAQATADIGSKAPSLGGRPLLDLPLDLIKEFENQGLKPREIHRQLVGKGIRVSIRTLYRILGGQRIMT